MPPPTVPGIQERNSNPPKLLFSANSERDLSLTILPAIMISSERIEILLKFFESLITIPSYWLSVINIFDPPPKTNIFSLFFIFF